MSMFKWNPIGDNPNIRKAFVRLPSLRLSNRWILQRLVTTTSKRQESFTLAPLRHGTKTNNATLQSSVLLSRRTPTTTLYHCRRFFHPNDNNNHDNKKEEGRTTNTTIKNWDDFVIHWNRIIYKRPQEVIGTFLSIQCTTWLGLYMTWNVLASSSTIGLVLPPELAIGWMVARLTKKFRQPVNVAIAASMIHFVPKLSLLQITPLVTGFANYDKQAQKDLQKTRDLLEQTLPRSIQPILSTFGKGVSWLEGPINKYGFAFYLSNKVSFLLTMSSIGFLVHKGIDVQSFLVYWNITDTLSETVATAAGSSACNVLFTPFHFYFVVHGITRMENEIRSYVSSLSSNTTTNNNNSMIPIEEWYEDFQQQRHEQTVEEEKEENEKVKNGQGDSTHHRSSDSSSRSSNNANDDTEFHEYIENRIMKTLSLILILYSLSVSMYALRRIGKSATATNEEPKEEINKEANEETNKEQTGPTFIDMEPTYTDK